MGDAGRGMEDRGRRAGECKGYRGAGNGKDGKSRGTCGCAHPPKRGHLRLCAGVWETDEKAGDGGTVRELTRYDTVEHIDMVEIDKMVVEVCKEYLPQTACRLNDSRVHLHFEDGLRYIRSKEDAYDLIIVDSTDPFGPGEGLFTKEFYGNCYKALTNDGILVNQHENAYYTSYAQSMRRAHCRIVNLFPICKVYQAHIPTYPSGHWLFGFASKKYDPVKDLDAEAWNRLGIDTRYYNTELHRGCFALPTYINQILERDS